VLSVKLSPHDARKPHVAVGASAKGKQGKAGYLQTTIERAQRGNEGYLVLEDEYVEDFLDLIFSPRRKTGKEEVGEAQQRKSLGEVGVVSSGLVLSR
jgi:hypothetical protein